MSWRNLLDYKKLSLRESRKADEAIQKNPTAGLDCHVATRLAMTWFLKNDGVFKTRDNYAGGHQGQ